MSLPFRFVYDLQTRDGKPQIAANSEEEAKKRYKKMFPEGPKIKDIELAYELKATKKSKNK